MKYVFWSLQKSTGIFCTRAKNLNLSSKNAPWSQQVISFIICTGYGTYNIMGFFFITFKTTNNQLSESWRVFVIPNKCQSQQLQQA